MAFKCSGYEYYAFFWGRVHSCHSILKGDQAPQNGQEQLCWAMSVCLPVPAVVGLSTLRSCRRSTYRKVDKTLASGALRASRGWECPRQGRGSGYKQEVFLHLHF